MPLTTIKATPRSAFEICGVAASAQNVNDGGIPQIPMLMYISDARVRYSIKRYGVNSRRNISHKSAAENMWNWIVRIMFTIISTKRSARVSLNFCRRTRSIENCEGREWTHRYFGMLSEITISRHGSFKLYCSYF